MNNMKKMLVVALALGVLFLPGCVYVRNLSGWSGIMEGGFKFNIGTPAYEEKGYEVFDTGKGGVLSIDADNIKLNIEGAQVSQIQVNYAKQVFGRNITPAEAQKAIDEMSLDFEEQNDGVRISASTGKKSNAGINVSKRLIALDIKVPVDMAIVIDSDNGAIGIHNVAGDINIDINNVAIELTDVSGNIKINNDNGAIRLASTSIGNLLLESDNGAINVSLGKLTGDSYTIETDNGMVNIALSQDIAAELEVTVENGKVSADFPLDRQGHTHTGSVGGGGPKIKVSTDNGVVNIERK
ncbi:MAG TPA: DUF4097 family beta strand repeat-containing protein [Candidatus Atribacteria bacterium]|nr:DUF4097 family beta strand repeat-containing protein [Candidatus Atribacteria bacterium]